jgi:transposase-like protein
MEGIKSGPMAKKGKVTCSKCSGAMIVKKGRRKNKFGQVQIYKCKSCGRSFSLRELR